MKAVEVKNLIKTYGDIRAVDGIDFDVNENEIFALIGPNGAGKSTTLRILATILTPSSGEAFVYGNNVRKDPDSVRKLISYLPEEAGAYKALSGMAYLKFMADLYTDDSKKKTEAVEVALRIANLGNRIKDKIKNYSKGMTRKLLLARAVMMKPKLAILDEPTSGLDVINAMEIRKIIRDLSRQGMSVLLSSHNMLEIEFLSDRVGLIHRGKMYEIGTAEELKKEHNAKNLEEVFMATAAINRISL
ncbi:MAG: ABC transporter ATP-binding protein [Candidatus Portnoybacteria bacterium]|nr:ABC transporter ATP-binding protein [Candidatus Portnoybacteria bacterium]